MGGAIGFERRFMPRRRLRDIGCERGSGETQRNQKQTQ
jgi:hypothetical protein